MIGYYTILNDKSALTGIVIVNPVIATMSEIIITTYEHYGKCTLLHKW